MHGVDASSRFPDSVCGDKRDRQKECIFEPDPDWGILKKALAFTLYCLKETEGNRTKWGEKIKLPQKQNQIFTDMREDNKTES